MKIKVLLPNGAEVFIEAEDLTIDGMSLKSLIKSHTELVKKVESNERTRKAETQKLKDAWNVIRGAK